MQGVVLRVTTLWDDGVVSIRSAFESTSEGSGDILSKRFNNTLIGHIKNLNVELNEKQEITEAEGKRKNRRFVTASPALSLPKRRALHSVRQPNTSARFKSTYGASNILIPSYHPGNQLPAEIVSSLGVVSMNLPL